MRPQVVLGAGIMLAVAAIALVPIASADHGPFCGSGDLSCCGLYEEGEEYRDCVVCVLVGVVFTTAWDTHTNQCKIQ